MVNTVKDQMRGNGLSADALVITRKEAASILGAIAGELESIDFRRASRDRDPIPFELEQAIRELDAQRAAELRALRDAIKEQLDRGDRDAFTG